MFRVSGVARRLTVTDKGCATARTCWQKVENWNAAREWASVTRARGEKAAVARLIQLTQFAARSPPQIDSSQSRAPFFSLAHISATPVNCRGSAQNGFSDTAAQYFRDQRNSAVSEWVSGLRSVCGPAACWNAATAGQGLSPLSTRPSRNFADRRPIARGGGTSSSSYCDARASSLALGQITFNTFHARCSFKAIHLLYMRPPSRATPKNPSPKSAHQQNIYWPPAAQFASHSLRFPIT